MARSLRSRGLWVGSVFAVTVLALPLFAQGRLTEQSKVAIDGIGPIRVGMTLAEAEKSAGVQLIEKGGRASSGCYYVWPKTGPQDLGFMVSSDRADEQMIKSKDRISRVDVFRNSRITTLSGAKIGDTEARIKALYPGRIRVTPHEYTGHRGGHYLTLMPKDAADKNYRVVFETLNGRVTQFRSGRVPEVEYVEGCA
jgi:phage tail sheath protein FI